MVDLLHALHVLQQALDFLDALSLGLLRVLQEALDGLHRPRHVEVEVQDGGLPRELLVPLQLLHFRQQLVFWSPETTYLEPLFERRPPEEPQQLEVVGPAGHFAPVDEPVEVRLADVLFEPLLELALLHFREVRALRVVVFALGLRSLAEVVPEVFDRVDFVGPENLGGVAVLVYVVDVFGAFDLGEPRAP